jgi:hypothetical protein
MGVWDFTKKVAKSVTGVQAYQDRKEAKRLKEEAEELYNDTLAENEARRESANNELTAFGRVRLESLQDTVGVFLSYLKIMKHNFTEKEYELSGIINLKEEEVNEMESVELTAKESLGTTAVAGSVAAAAVAGVPTAVTSAVTALASTSSGVAISSLHGAAAYNATMAWLGGGSLAVGGSGMAGGALALTTITYATAGFAALAAGGIVAGMHYSKKLTAATEYYSEVCKYREQAECAWALMDGIVERAHELQAVTLKLRKRIHNQLNLLEPLIYDFVADDPYYVETFQQTALLVKTMSELSQIPVLDEKGYVSQSSKLEIVKVNKILNKKL